MSTLNDWWRQQTKTAPAVTGSRATKSSSRRKFCPWETYRRWWRGRTTADGKHIKDIVWHGNPSGVYGVVELLFDDGSTRTVATQSYRPRKGDVKLLSRLSDRTNGRKTCN